MPSDLTAKRRTIVTRQGRRRPNFTALAASDRHPNGDDRIPLAQRKTIATVVRFNCRWPYGDPKRGNFYLCGAPAHDDESYCAYHMEIAYISAPNPKRAA